MKYIFDTIDTIDKTTIWIIGLVIGIFLLFNGEFIAHNIMIKIPYNKTVGEEAYHNAYKGWNAILESVEQDGEELILGDVFQTEEAIVKILEPYMDQRRITSLYSNYIYETEDGRLALRSDIYLPMSYDGDIEIGKIYLEKSLANIFSDHKRLVVEERGIKGSSFDGFSRKSYFEKNDEGQWIHSHMEGRTSYHNEDIAVEFLRNRGIIE